MKSNTKLEQTFFGNLAVQLRHAGGAVDELSQLIGLPTTREWNALDVVQRGPNLPSRLRGENFWASDIELVSRNFAGVIGEVVLSLNKRRKEIAEFAASGGKLELYLMLSGSVNGGDRLSPDLLRSLAELNVSLDIEVFPEFERPLSTRVRSGD